MAKCGPLLTFLNDLCDEEQKAEDETRKYNWIFNAGDEYYNDVQRNLFASLPDVASLPAVEIPIDVCHDRREYFRSPDPVKGDLTEVANLPPSKRLLVMSGRIDFYWYSGEYASAHGIVFLIDRQKKTIEIFEPNGDAPWTDALIEMVTPFFFAKDSPFLGYSLLPPIAICPRTGPQEKADDSFCAAWSELYAYLRAKCPDTKSQELTRLIINRPAEQLRKLLENWICFIGKFAQERRIRVVHSWLREPRIADLPRLDVNRVRQLQFEGNSPEAFKIIRRIDPDY